MIEIALKNGSLEFSGSRWFTGNAPMITLGAYGEKAGGTLHIGKLEPKDRLPPKALSGRVRSAGPFKLNAVATSRAQFSDSVEVDVKAVGFEGGVGAVYDALAVGKLKFVQLYLDENDLRDLVNARPEVRDEIHGYGADGRIVHSVFIAMVAQTAEAFSKQADVSLALDAKGIVNVSVAAGAGSAGVVTVALPPGTCLAYGLLKLEWSGRDDKFVGSHVDEPGLK